MRAAWMLLLVVVLATGLAGCTSHSNAAPAGPMITSLSSTSGAVGASITITGTGFGATQGTSAVTFGGVAASITTWSDTSIVLTVPAGAATGNVIVTVSSVASNSQNFVVPAILMSLSQISGVAGTAITITGSNFGAAQGSSTVTFNGVAAAAASAWSATSITVNVPAAASTGSVVVTVSAVASNGLPFTVGPAITSLSQTSGAVSASITITGTGFGATQSTSTVKFNGVTAAAASAWSASSITVAVPAGATTGNVVVTVGTLASNGSLLTIVPPPSITSLSQISAAVGVPITITGTNFGAAQGTSTVTFNGVAAAAATAWSATSATVKVPAGATTGNVVVTVLGSASNGSPFTVVGAPTIASLSQTSGAIGVSITITGLNFGATQAASTVTFNGTAAVAASVWSATSITVTVPTGATTGNVVVTVLGAASNGSLFTVVLGPMITTLSQTSGAVGASVTITGTNFGATQGTSTLAFDGTVAVATSWSATSITTTVPSGAANGNVVVTVLGTTSNGAPFTIVPPPAITSLSPTSAAIGAPITITGTNFGATQGTSTVTFNGTAAGAATSWSATSISVAVPAGATTGNVVVTVLGSASNGSPFTPGPAIASLSKTSGAVGVALTISGTNFGATQNTSTVTFNGTAAAAATTWSATSVTVTVPAGATTGNVVVTVGGIASNGSPFTVVLAPAITGLSQTSGAIGTPITVAGSNFGATQGSSTVTFNGIAAAAASSWSATSVTVIVPSGAATGNVIVTVLGSASNGSAFTVTPSCTTNCALSGTVTGAWVSGVTITITGPSGSTTTTNSLGNYSFTGLTAGSYTITPSLAGYSFTPVSPIIDISGNIVQNFVATSLLTSFSVSGTITYAGAATGNTIVRVFPNSCLSCGSVAGTSFSSAPTAGGISYTIRGLPSTNGGGPGSYIISAQIDTLHNGVTNESNPEGDTVPFTIPAADITGANITVVDRTPSAAPSAPTGFNVSPGAGTAFVQYQAERDANNEEIPTAYKVYYGTDVNASNGSTSPVTFKAQGSGADVLILTGIPDGATFFKLSALNVDGESAATTPVSATIGAGSGANTVSGTVTFPGTATGPLYVGVFGSTGVIYPVVIANPVSPQTYTLSGVPSGSYQNFAILDMNNDGEIDAGDLDNVGNNQNPQTVTVSGPTTGVNVTLANPVSTPFVATNVQGSASQPNTYSINLGISPGSKLPVSMTLFSGPNVAVPFDMNADTHNSSFSPIFNSAVSPTVGDTYQFLITFSDGSSQVISAQVTAVLSSFAENLTMNSPVANTATIPELNWIAPAMPPAVFFYSVGLNNSNGTPQESWSFSGNGASNGLPSSQLSVLFNVDGSASPSASLISLSTYTWHVTVTDVNNNSGTFTVVYIVP